MRSSFMSAICLLLINVCIAQNVGIGTVNPQATLDVKGNQRIGGVNHFMNYDSATGNLLFNNRIAISDLSDGWLRLNQSNNYSNGISTPNIFRADGPIYTPVLYDLNNSGYYIDPASTSNTNVLRFNTADCLNGYCPPNGAIRFTPNFHLNSNAGNAVIMNWDNGTTGNTQTFRVGNGVGADAFYVNANGNVVAMGNIGINAASPNYPLSFPNVLGDKISLWGNSGAHYGFGMQSSLMQIYTDVQTSDIAFGYGSSGAFTESMRMKGNGTIQFPASLQKKIILYPGSTGDAGLGVFGNEMRIASDYSGADITFGYDNRSTGFAEKFRMKANGALAINGSAGAAGQVLQTNGSGSSPSWINNPVSDMYNYAEEIPATGQIQLADGQQGAIPGLSKQLNLTKPSKVIVRFMLMTFGVSCTFCGGSTFDVWIVLDGANTGYIRKTVDNANGMSVDGCRIFTLGPGTHNISLSAITLTGPDVLFAINPPTVYPSFLLIEVIPDH